MGINEFSKIRKAFTQAGETTSTPENPETSTETHTTETEETGNTSEPETAGASGQTPEQSTTSPPETISVYDYFEKKLAAEDKNL